ncbi:methylenetetrahydrofolate reductase [Spirochaetota bacterium]
MGLQDSLNDGKFAVIAEIDPPKGCETAGLFEKTDPIKGRVDALLVTDMPSAVMKLGSLSVSYLLKERGFDTIFNLTCRDRNVLALQSDLLNASALGIENIYITRGDEISLGDHPRVCVVNEVNEVEMLSIVRGLEEGKDWAGNKLESSPKFNTGSYLNLNMKGEELENEMREVGEKHQQGASFFITPAVFDPESFGESIEKIRKVIDVPIIAEIILLKSVATARFLNKHVDHITVSDSIIDRMYSAGDKLAESMSITADIIKGLRGLCEGIKIVPLGWEEKLPSFFDAAGL